MLSHSGTDDFAMVFNQMVRWAHGRAVESGWWTNIHTGERIERNKGELIALMHSELSEALEAIRKDKMDDKLPTRKGEEVELVDCIIRIFDYAGAYGLDLGGAFMEKMAYNQNRADHKISNRKVIGGKQF
jgi:NTP pyrophosphatase (non-canonical NTP hydrolase)